MYTITAKSVNHALVQALDLIQTHGVEKSSRNGPVLVVPRPVTTHYICPQNHVLTSPLRNANPFFHFMEAMWMLHGAHDVATVARYAKTIAQYSDDGTTLNGAYGYRWRRYFGYDQLDWIIYELKNVPDTRRCVLSMWDAGTSESDCCGDLYLGFHGQKDVPCNTHAYFSIANGALDMMVCNRSNDLLWGAYGANAVHFSMLLEYMADCVGCNVGSYHQVTNNLHLYTDVLAKDDIEKMMRDVIDTDVYSMRDFSTYTRREREDWERAARLCVSDNSSAFEWSRFTHKFFYSTARNILLSWQFKTQRRYEEALIAASSIETVPWRIACMEWLERNTPLNKKNKEVASA